MRVHARTLGVGRQTTRRDLYSFRPGRPVLPRAPRGARARTHFLRRRLVYLIKGVKAAKVDIILYTAGTPPLLYRRPRNIISACVRTVSVRPRVRPRLRAGLRYYITRTYVLLDAPYTIAVLDADVSSTASVK